MLGRSNRGVWRASAAGIALALALASCGDDGGEAAPAPGDRVAEKLSRALQFVPESMLINGPLPATTAPRTALLPLGPPVVVSPMDTAIMAFEVQDPEQRPVAASLVQFEDALTYQRVPPREGEGSHVVIENTLVAAEDLCEGLCDAIFSVTVSEAVELENGEVSTVSRREIVIDCREAGDPEACDEDMGGIELLEQLPCGDVTMGLSALAGDRTLDAHLEAVRVFATSIGSLNKAVNAIRGSLTTALGLPADSDADALSAALEGAVEDNTEAGLALLLGDRGCALRREQVAYSLATCDPDAAMLAPELICTGVCQPAGDAAVCETAVAGGCRGLIEDAECADTCLGACQTELDEPAACAGTCVGTCDGECPGDGDSCAGPCDGLCSGECRSLSEGVCGGLCTGLCDEPSEGAPACEAPLEPYCSTAMDAALACPGDCFGSAELTDGAALCRPSALSIGRALPRCDPTLAQLSFTFAAGVDPAAQTAFATLVNDLNTPFAQLFETLARIDLLLVASADLSAASTGAIDDYLGEQLTEMPDATGLACAQQRLPAATTWLESQPEQLEALRDQAMQLLSVVLP